MAVDWIREHWPDRGGEFGKITERTARRHWKCVVTDKTDNEQTIYQHGIQHGILPQLFESHPDSEIVTCRRVRIRNEADSWKHWSISAEYSSEPLDQQDEEDEGIPPLDRPAKIWRTSQEGERALVRDRNGNAFLTSAGNHYGAQVIDVSTWIIHFQKNLPDEPAWVQNYADNPVNQSALTIRNRTYAAETLKLKGLEVSEFKVEQDQEFVVVTGELHHDPGGWDLVLLDEDVYDSNGDRLKDGNGKDVVAPIPLDGAGSKLASPTPSTVVYNTFEVRERRDFNVLPVT